MSICLRELSNLKSQNDVAVEYPFGYAKSITETYIVNVSAVSLFCLLTLSLTISFSYMDTDNPTCVHYYIHPDIWAVVLQMMDSIFYNSSLIVNKDKLSISSARDNIKKRERGGIGEK